MASSRDKRWQAKARQELKKRVVEITARSAEDLDQAFDKLIHEQPDLYFRLEEGFEEVHQTILLVGEELEGSSGITELERLDRRIEFIEDRFEEGCTLTAVTRAFRQKAKELHPDSRDGDRSGEPKLRRLIAAYQYLKSIYNSGDDNVSPANL